jgi:hypothetical protein
MPSSGHTPEPGSGGVRRSWLREPLTWMGFAIIVVMIGGTTLSNGTTAFFTFTAWITGNVFQSGTVSLVASRTSSTELAVDRLLPGDVLTRRLKVENPTSILGGPTDVDCSGAVSIYPAASSTFTATPRSAARCTAYFMSIVPKSLDKGTTTPVPTLLEHDVANGLHVAVFRCSSDAAGAQPVQCPEGTTAGSTVYMREVTGLTGGSAVVQTDGRALGKADMSVASGTLRIKPGGAVQSVASSASGTFATTPLLVEGKPILTARNERCNPEFFDYPTPPGLRGTPRFTRTPTTYTPTATYTPSPTATATASRTATLTSTASLTPTGTGTTVIQYDAVGRIITQTPQNTPTPVPTLTPPPPGAWSYDAFGRIVTWTPTVTSTPDPSAPTAYPTPPLADACAMGGPRTGLTANGLLVNTEGTTFNIPSGLSYSGLAPGDADYLYLFVWLPTSAGNEFQELSQRYAVVLTAVQPAPSGIAAAPTATGFPTRTVTPTNTSSPTRTATVGATATVTPTPDAVPPYVSRIVLAGGATPLAGPNTQLAFTIEFSKPVQAVTAADFNVVKGQGISGTPFVSKVEGVATSWKVTVDRNGASGNQGVTGNATIGLAVVPGQTARDAAGNAMTSAVIGNGGAAYTLDTVGPTFAVTYARTSPVTSGNLAITVTSNEALRHAPTIAIDQAGTTDIAATTMVPASGTNAYTYTYTVNAANAGAFLDGTATASVSSTDTTGNVGTTITSGASFVVDTTPPSVALTYTIATAVPADSAAASGLAYAPTPTRPVRASDVVIVKAVATDASALASPVTLALSGGRTIASVATYTAADLTTYHAYTVQPSQDGPATVSVAGPDVAGNAAVATGATTFTVDTTAPVVTLAYAIANAVPNTATASDLSYGSALTRPVRAGDFVVVRATTVEANALAAPISLALDGSRVITPLTNYTAATSVGTTYHFYAVGNGQDGTATVSVTAPDTAGNAATTSGATTFAVDTTAPTVVLAYSDGGQTDATGPYKAGDTVTVTATFTEAVSLQGTPSLTLVPDAYAGGTLPTVSLASAGNALRYSGTFTIPAGNGSVTATVNASDTAGNALNATGQTGFAIDNVAPVAALTYSLDATTFATVLNRTVRDGDTVTIRATFSEVGGIAGTPTITFTQVGNVTVPSPQAMTATSDPLTSDPLAWTYVYTIPNVQNGTVSAVVAATDRAGNQSTSAEAEAFTIVNDLIPPTVLSIARAGGATQLTNGATPPTFTVTFDEAIVATPGSFEVIVGTGVTGTAPTIASVTGSNTAVVTVTVGLAGATGDYGTNTNATLGVRPRTSGSDRVRDRAGNQIVDASVQGNGANDSYFLDNVGPRVATITRANAAPALTTGYPAPTFAVTTNEDVTGLDATNFQIDAGGGVVGTPTIASVTGSGTAWTVTLGMSGVSGNQGANGTEYLALTVVGGANAIDLAGNALTVASVLGANEQFTLDGTPPTATITYAPNRPVKAGETVTITATLSEPLATSPTIPSISLSGTNTLASTPLTKVTDTSWTYNHIVGQGNGTTSVTLIGADPAGNAIGTVTGASFVVDNLAPTAALDFRAGAQSSPFREGQSVTVTATVSDANAISGTPTLTLGGTGSIGPITLTETTTGSKVYRGTVPVPPGNGTVTATFVATDIATNTLTQSGVTAFSVDNVAPAVTIRYQIIPDSTQTLPTSGYASTVSRPIHDGESLAIEVVATDAGTITGNPTISATLTGDATPRAITLVEATGSAGTRVWRGSFDVPHNTTTYDGPATVALSVTGVRDDAGNDAVVASGQTFAFVIDNTPPSVAIAYQVTDKATSPPASGYVAAITSPINGTRRVAIQVTVTETGGGATLTGAPTVAVTPLGASASTSVSMVESPSGSKVWRGAYDVPTTGNDGVATVSVNVSAMRDDSLNVATLAGGQVTSFAIDNTPPLAALAYHRLAKGDPDPALTYGYDDSLTTPLNGTQDLAIQLTVTETGGTGTVTGSPSLGITINGTTTPVTLTQTATGSKVWRGRFTSIPTSGDSSATIVPNLSAIADEATNAATLATGQVTNFSIDNTKPSVTLDYLIDGASYVAAPRAVRGADAGMTVRATFTNTSSLGGTPTITLSSTQSLFTGLSSGAQPMVPTAGQPLVWTYRQAVPTAGDGTIDFTVNAADPAGNVVTETHELMRVDNSFPYVTEVKRVGAATTVLTSASTAQFDVTFVDDVQGVTTAAFAVENGSATTGTTTIASVTRTDTDPNASKQWRVTVGSLATLSGDYGAGTNPSATIGLTVSGTGITDLAGNPYSGAYSGTPAPTTNETFSLDNVAPSFDVTYTPVSPVKAGTVTITAVATEPLTTLPTISIDQQGSSDVNPPEAMTGSIPGTTFTYSRLIESANGGLHVDGTAQVRAFGTDQYGNTTAAGTSPRTGATFVIDTTSPVVALTYAITSAVPANATAAAGLTYTAGSARPVTVGDVVVVKAITTEAVGLNSAVSLALDGNRSLTPLETYTAQPSVGTTYFTHTVSPSNDGTATISATGPDTAGNPATLSGIATFTVDTTPPTAPTALSLTAVGGVNQIANTLNGGNTNFTVTATITGDVGSAGGTAELLVGGASFSTPVKASVASGATSVSLTPSFTTTAAVQAAMTAGSKSLTVKLTDSAGNVATSTPLTVLADYTAPTASVSRLNAQLTRLTPAYSVTFSEPVSGVVATNFAITKGTGISGNESIGISSSTPPTTTYTITVSNLTGDYGLNTNATFDLTLKPSGAPVTDAAGNIWVGADALAGVPYWVDTIRPTVTSITSSDSGPKKEGATVAITVTFSENVTTTGTPSLAMNTGGSATCAGVGSPSPTLACTYTVRASDTSGTRLDYASRNALTGTIIDGAGNGYIATTGLPIVGTAADGVWAANITVDRVAPTVVSVTATSATYYRTMRVPISVNFTEAVTVTGLPTVTLSVCLTESDPCDSPTTRTAEYASGSGTAVLAFRYVVKSGDSTLGPDTPQDPTARIKRRLQYESVSALSLGSSGTIADSAGNAATLTLPALTSAQSLGASSSSSNVVIDGVFPFVDDGQTPSVSSVSATVNSGSYRAGQIIPVTITFSEVVVVTGTPTLQLATGANSGAGTAVAYTSGSGTEVLTFTYTVSAGDNTAPSAVLDYVDATALKFPGLSGITDLTGTALPVVGGVVDAYLSAPGTNSLQSNRSILIDTSAPTIALAYSRGIGSPPILSVGAVTLTITSDEDLAIAPAISINQPGTTDIANATTLGSVPGKTFTYVYTVTLQTGTTYIDGTTAVSVVGSDAAGNTTTATSSFITDTVTPAVTRVSTTLAAGTYGAGTVVPVNVTFNKAVNVTPSTATFTGSIAAGSTTLTVPANTPTLVVGQVISGNGITPGTTIATVASATTYTVSAPATSFTGTIAANSTTLTVTAVTAGKIVVGQTITGGSIPANTTITGLGTGIGGIGTYTLSGAPSSAQNGIAIQSSVASTNITASGPSLALATTLPTSTGLAYGTGSGTSVLSFLYTVQPGDSSADLNYVATTSLVAAGALIQDRAGTNATLTLPALAGASSLAGTSAVVVETVRPTVQSVTAPSGTYLQGFAVPISVKFSEPVTVASGTPTLFLANNGSASYASGAGTDTLVFSYTVGASDSFASDLNYAATNDLSGSITDVPGNLANLTLPAPASASSLSGTSDIIVDSSRTSKDTTPPTVDLAVGVSSTKASGPYGVGSTIPITVTFTENVVVTGTPTLALDTASPTSATYTAGSGTPVLTFTYTVAPNDTTNGASLNYTATSALALPSGATIKDQSGNTATLQLPDLTSDQALRFKGIVIDTVAPTFAVTYTASTFTGSITGTVLGLPSAPSSGALAVGQVIACASTNPQCGIAPGTTIVSGNALLWQVNISQTVASTAMTGTTPASVPTFKAGAITVTATSSKPLAAPPSLSIDQQGTTDIVSVAMSGSAPGTTFTYTYTVTAATGGTYIDGAAALSISGTDLGSNVGTTISSGATFRTDTVAPTITGVSTAARSTPYKLGDTIDITVTYSEPLGTVLSAATLPILVPGNANAAYVASASDPGAGKLVFRYTVASGHATANLINSTPIGAATGIYDVATNAASTAVPTTGGAELGSNPPGIVIDGVLPAILNVTGTSGTYGPGATVPITITIKFAEPIIVVGTPTLTLTGASVTASVNTAGQLNVTALGTPPLRVDYGVTGAGILPGTYILPFGTNGTTGTGANAGTYALSTGATVFTGRIDNGVSTTTAGTVLTVTGVTSGAILVGQTLNGVTTTTTISAQTSGTPGGIGTYTVATSQLSPSATITTSVASATVTAGQRATCSAHPTLTDSLECQYVVTTQTPSSAKLQYAGTNALTSVAVTGLTGGVTDVAGNPIATNPATSPLPALTVATSLGSTTANAVSPTTIVIDTTGPTVSAVFGNASSGTGTIQTNYYPGQTIPISVRFNEPVVVTPSSASFTASITGNTLDVTAVTLGSLAVGQTISGTGVTYGMTIAGQSTGLPGGPGQYTLTQPATQVTGSISTASGGTLTVTAVSSGKIVLGQVISGAGVTANTRVTSFGTGTGGTGTYGVSVSQTIASTTLTAGAASTDMTAAGPTLSLGTGSPASTGVSYASGSGTDTLIFNYTVNTGNTVTKLNYVATTSLVTGGASITDSFGNAATLTLPALTASTSLGGTSSPSNMKINPSGSAAADNTAPIVWNVTSSAANGSKPKGTVIPIQILFSEAVLVSGTPTLRLGTGANGGVGTDVPYSSGSGSNTLTFNYTVQEGDSTGGANLNYVDVDALKLPAGATITDFGLNSSGVVNPLANYPGNANTTSYLPPPTPTTVASFSATIATTNMTITSTTSGTVAVGQVISGAGVTAGTYITGGTGSPWPISVSQTVSTATAMTASASLGGTKAIVIDTTAPTVALSYWVSFTGSISGTTLNVTTAPTAGALYVGQPLFGANIATGTTITGFGTGAGLVGTYTISPSPTVASQTIYGQRPSPYGAGAVVVAAVASETLAGAPTIGIDQPGTTDIASTTAMTALAGVANTYTYSYTVVAATGSTYIDGTANVTVRATDPAGNVGSAGSVSNVITSVNGTPLGDGTQVVAPLAIDTVLPVVTNVTSPIADGTYTTTATIPVTVSFSKPVFYSGPRETPSTLQVTSATAPTASYATYASGSGTDTLTYNYVPTVGQSSTDLNYNATTSLITGTNGYIRDAAGNGATLTLPATTATNALAGNKNIAIDAVPPSVALAFAVSGVVPPTDAAAAALTWSAAKSYRGRYTPFTGSVAGTTLTVSGTPSLSTGQYIGGPGIPANTTISAVLTLTTYTLSVAQPSMTGRIDSGTAGTAGTILTITTATTGQIAVGQVLSGSGVTSGTKVTGFLTGTGGVGTYQVNTSQNVPSTTITGTVPSGTDLFTRDVILARATTTEANALASVPTLTYVGPGGRAGTFVPINPNYTVQASNTNYYAFVPTVDLPATTTFDAQVVHVTAPDVVGNLATSSATSVTGRIDSGTAGQQGTTFTVTTATAGNVLRVGQVISGVGVVRGTTITSFGTGTGGVGTYTVDVPAAAFVGTISGTTLTVSSIASGMLYAGQVVSGSGVISGTKVVRQLTGALGGAGTHLVDTSQTTGSQAMSGARTDPTASFTGTIAGTTMTVSAVSAGTLTVGQTLTGTGVTAATTIFRQIDGTPGAVGTYEVSLSQSVSTATTIAATVASTTVGAPAFTIDDTAPKVASVTSTSNNVTVGVGTAVPITVTFDEPITTTGVSNLVMNTGTNATCAAVTNVLVLSCSYTPVGGNSADPLDVNSASALTGTIRDQALNNYVSTNGLLNLGISTNAIKVDTDPYVTGITSALANGTYGKGYVVDVDMNFSRAMTIVPNAIVTGSISGTSLTTVQSGTLAIGQSLYGTGVTPGTTITAGSGTSWTVSIAQPSMTGRIDNGTVGNPGTTLTITTATTGQIAVGQVLSGSGVTSGTKVSGFLTGTGGVGTYQVDTSQNVPSTTITGTVPSTTISATALTLPITSTTAPTTSQAYYVSGDGTASFKFRYIVQAGQSSADLTNGTPFVCGGTPSCTWIKASSSTVTNALSSTLDTLATAPKSLAFAKALVIDAVAPSAPTSPTVTTAGGNVVAGYVNSTNTSVTISATITAAQVGTSGKAEMLVGGNSIGVTTTAGTPSNTATSASVTLSSSISTNIPSGSRSLSIRLQDSVTLANNGPNVGAASTGVTVIADYARPNVTGTSTTQTSGTVNAGTSIPFTITFNEAVTAGPQNLDTSVSPTSRKATCSAVTASTTMSCTYYVAPGDTSSALSVPLNTLSGVTDVAGNPIFTDNSDPFFGLTIVVDGTR